MAGDFNNDFNNDFSGGSSSVPPYSFDLEVTAGPPILGAPWAKRRLAEGGLLQQTPAPDQAVIMCGFETGDSTEFSASGTANLVQSGTARLGGYALRVNPVGTATSSVLLTTLAATGSGQGNTYDDLYVRFYFLFNLAIVSSSEELMQVCTSSLSRKLALRLQSTGTLRAFAGNGTTSLGIGSSVLVPGTWYRIDVYCGTGTNANFTVRLNGATEISGSGNLIATQGGCVRLGKPVNINGNSVDYFYDDVIARNDRFPDDSHIVALKPFSVGTYDSWTVGGGTSSKVEDVKNRPRDDFGYLVSTLAAGDGQTFVPEPLSRLNVSGLIQAVKPIVIVRSDTFGGSLKLRLRSQIDYDTSASSPSTSYTARHRVFSVDPATGLPWRKATVEACEFGVVENSASAATRVTSAFLMVDAAVAEETFRAEFNPPELRWGPAMRGAPWAVRLPDPEGGHLKISPPPPPPPPPVYAGELRWGPPIRGAPWATRLAEAEGGHLRGTVILPGNPGGAEVPITRKPFLPRLTQHDDLRRALRFSEKLAMLVNSLIAKGLLVQVGQDQWELRSGGFSDTRAPTAADDSSTGATPGCTWINTATGDVYVCRSSTRNAAVWRGPI